MSHYTLPRDLANAIQAQKPEGMAIEFNCKIYSWQFISHVLASVNEALQVLGIEIYERIGFVAHSRPAHVAAFWALLIHERCPSMIYGYQSPEKIAADIRSLRPPLVIADLSDWNEITISAARETGCAGLALSSEGVTWVEDLTSVGPNTNRSHVTLAAVETLSSGTTGTPKRILLSKTNLQASTLAACSAIRQMMGALQSKPGIIGLPLGNISGVYAMTPAGIMGQPIALMEKFDIDNWLNFVQRYQPATADVPPAALVSLFQRGITKQDIPSVRVIRTGAAPLNREAHHYFAEQLGIPINLSYGASEFCGVITTWTMEDLQQHEKSKRGSCGRPLPGVELRVIDPVTHSVLTANQVGQLEAKVDRISPDWIRTNDLARLDEQGFMYFEGRADSAIMRGGFKIIPEQVTEALLQHPAVADAGVVGIPNLRLGQIPVAAFQLRPGFSAPSEQEFAGFLRHHLSAPQIPVKFVQVNALPRTASLKLHIQALTEQLSSVIAE